MLTNLTAEQLADRFNDSLVMTESEAIQADFERFMADLDDAYKLPPMAETLLTPDLKAIMDSMDPPLTGEEIREFVDGIPSLGDVTELTEDDIDFMVEVIALDEPIPAVTDEEIEELFKEDTHD